MKTREIYTQECMSKNSKDVYLLSFLGASEIPSNLLMHFFFHYLTHCIGKTDFLADSNIVFTLKMESVSKIKIFGLIMLVKSCLEKIFLKFLNVEVIFL